MNTKINTNDYVIIGQIGAPYAIKGWVHLQSFMEEQAGIMDFAHWQLKAENDSWQPVRVTNIRPHGKGFVAKLELIDNPEQAALFTNRYIAVERDFLPELATEEHYWVDLLQLEVFDQANTRLGIVTSILETGANDVLVVTDVPEISYHAQNVAGVKEYLIPYIPGQYVLQVDSAAKKILVAWDDLENLE